MKTITQTARVVVVTLAIATLMSACKASAANSRHEFKKEMKAMARCKR